MLKKSLKYSLPSANGDDNVTFCADEWKIQNGFVPLIKKIRRCWRHRCASNAPTTCASSRTIFPIASYLFFAATESSKTITQSFNYMRLKPIIIITNEYTDASARCDTCDGSDARRRRRRWRWQQQHQRSVIELITFRLSNYRQILCKHRISI